MAKNDFFQSVRTAVRFVAPRVEIDNPYDKPQELEQRLSEAVIWLTPKSVEGFDPKNLESLPQTERKTLIKNVEKFVSLAEEVPPDKPAKPEQVKKALPIFLDIVGAVQTIMRNEWTQAAAQLIAEASAWADAKDWPTKLYAKQIAEDFIGTYELQKLVFAVEGSQLVLNPVGRFVPGAEGMFDLAVLPVYESVMVVRQKDRWYIQPLPGEDRRRSWSEAAFVETAQKLARLA